MVEAEAAAAEAEHPDEPDTPAEPEPEPEPQAIDPKALERALRAHEKAMAKVMGDSFADAELCAACEGVGYTPKGHEAAPEILHDEQTEACPKCNGYGQVLTGARSPADPTRMCTTCSGGGYVTKPVELGPGLAAVPEYAPAAAYAPPLPAAPIDPADVERLRRAGYIVSEPYVPPAVPGA